MRYLLSLFAIVCSLTSMASREKINENWKFFLGDNPAAKEIKFNDSSWEVVNVPHDWAFENGYDQENGQKDKGGYAMGGIGWYRKVFNFTADELQKNIFIDFDAIYMNSEVWINGYYLGKRPYGYISFSYELSKYLNEGENILSVRVDNSLEPSARWYHGCGIYADAYIRTENDVFFEKDATFITTPEADGRVNIATDIHLRADAGNYTIESQIFDGSGNKVATVSHKADLKMGSNSIEYNTNVKNPALWSVESPALYTVKTTIVSAASKLMDSEEIRIGFRKIDWIPATGFHLNGKQLKLRGVADHLEGGPTGAIYTEQLLRWKIQLLKDMGCNAIRLAHNPQIPIFYDICDEMGMLVMDEIFDGWMKKADFDYGMQAFDEWWERDLRAWIRRDRNHASIFMYSVGNETHNEDTARELVRVCHEEDDTRLVTSGDCEPDIMDVYGVNGRSETADFIDSYKNDRQAFVATENPHTWQVRGYYRSMTWYRDAHMDVWRGEMTIPDLTEEEIFTYDWISPEGRRNRKQIFNSSYDNAIVRVNARRLMEVLRDKEWFSGSFRWTGFDYLGEAGYVHGGWPFRAFQGGALDLAGFEKDLYYLYQSEWRDDLDMVHILPHWTHPKMKVGTKIPVWVYTTGDEVELIVNGESLGRKAKGKSWDKMQCEWMVPWKEGKVEAIAYRDGKEIARTFQQSSGAPTQIALSVENSDLKADNENISIVTIRQEDENGTLYPYGENRVHAHIVGAARMLSYESGSPVDVETNFLASDKECFFGLNRAFIQSTDKDSSKPVSVVFAAINGDKKLMLSDKISIDVKEVSLRGRKPSRDFKVYYTTDGSTPTTSSTLYTTPFAIKLETTVKAVVYDGAEKLIEMEELFSQNDGLYWLSPGEATIAFTGEQAELAELESCFKTGKDADGQYGDAYVIPAPNKGKITWYQENDGGPMEATVKIRYSQDSEGETTTMELSNNGEFIKTVEFNHTGSVASHWRETEPIKVKIHSGGNNITLKSTSAKSASIDQITIE
ncbi:MAG: glycoside hydrolase family 2 TIM barrel-domain containing protein [Rikenellaceae bacterium]